MKKLILLLLLIVTIPAFGKVKKGDVYSFLHNFITYHFVPMDSGEEKVSFHFDKGEQINVFAVTDHCVQLFIISLDGKRITVDKNIFTEMIDGRILEKQKRQ